MDELQDIELDSEGQGSMSGGAPVVRKTISLNLTKKTKLKAKSSAKSSKTKKERRERNENSNSSSNNVDESNNDAKVSRRSKTTEKKRETTDDDDREDEELDWSHKVMFVGEKLQNPMIHVCEKCVLPILIYGRLSPCKHVFCLSCAEKSNGVCTRCEERIERIEPAGIGQIFVCSFGGSRHGVSECRRSYLSQRDLIAHIKHRHEKEGSTIPESELMRQQGVVAMPFLNTTPTANMLVPPSLSMPSTSQANGHVIMPRMPTQPAMFVDTTRMPIMPSQPQFQTQMPPQNMPMSQPQFQQPPPPYMPPPPQGQAQYPGMPPQPPQQPAQPQGGQQQQRGEEIQGRNNVEPPPPPPPQGDWRGGNQMPSNGQQDWGNQGRSGNYQGKPYY